MKTFLVFILTFSLQAANAQAIEVYFTKGDVTVSNNGKIQPNIQKGYQLKNNDILELNKDQMAVLYQEQKALVLRGPGTYPYSKIDAQFAETKKSLSDRYIGYLWKQAHEGDSPNEDEGKGKMGVKGMVSRGANGIVGLSDSILVLRETFVVDFDAGIMPGFIFLYNGKKPILKLACDSAAFELMFGGDLKKGEWYGMAASSTDNPPFNSIQYFKWATETELADIQADFAKFLAEIEDYPEDMKSELITAYLEVNNYLYTRD